MPLTRFQLIADVTAARYGVERVLAVVAGLAIFPQGSGGYFSVLSTPTLEALDRTKVIFCTMRMRVACYEQLLGTGSGHLVCTTHAVIGVYQEPLNMIYL